MHKIVFLDRATLAPQITLRRPGFAHELAEYAQTHPEDVAARIAGASIVITNKVALTADILAQSSGLKLVAVAATGTDCVDKAACARHGVAVANIRGYAVNTVPEHTFALMLALRRNLIAYRDDVLNGVWQKSGQFCFFDHPIRDLAGATLGIIGEGVLGQRVAEIAKVFGARPIFAAHKGSQGFGPLYTPWDQMLATSDIITVHSPLTPQTRGMLAMPEFRAMKRKPLIINTARGGLVDEADLARALDEGLISGAGFDVVSGEPPAADNPLMRIAGRPNVIVTPHVAWASDEAQQALADQLIDNIESFIAGTPRNLVQAAL
ncbi:MULTISPECIES: D-2-hydroxyacid dehydrogenase [unclassified Caballeronia]|uniref:D-2-hydroxyacid dehydrogenase n=1 Tax=unclassified Caballeronia TaxID=2646786 RepID=UPI00285D47DC|nr:MULTISPECIES: D-2-hydroxyacid dehydrogenase [unclassified Caballeronia]MDR5752317.1 D-2-hydroxyacid dehydrogenase [Caballeronia sp. LZ024]MDR5841835.1 D-2-hydroxyacid dehydrogenase [Caballeronia sp. LZ031]